MTDSMTPERAAQLASLAADWGRCGQIIRDGTRMCWRAKGHPGSHDEEPTEHHDVPSLLARIRELEARVRELEARVRELEDS